MTELLFGRHAVFHLLRAARRKPFRLFLQKGLETSEKEIVDLARKRGAGISLQEAAFFKARFGTAATHQGIAVEADAYPYASFDQLLKEDFLLVLDEVQDPHNLGALCRSAYLLGVGGVVIPETHAALVGPGACQASVGAVEYLKIAKVSSIAKSLALLKSEHYWVYGASADAAKNAFEEAFPQKVALVIGNEEKGLRRLVRESCDLLVKIPSVHQEIDSYNASVSGGILLYEILRQRLQKMV